MLELLAACFCTQHDIFCPKRGGTVMRESMETEGQEQ